VTTTLYLGIDVSKDKLDLGRHDGNHILTFSNDPRGIAQLLKHLINANATLIA
jgi:transposase